MLTLYIARCADGTYYTGVAKNMDRRVRQHNGEVAGGAKYTRPRRPVRIVFERVFEDDSEARRMEYRVKKLSRPDKERLVNGQADLP